MFRMCILSCRGLPALPSLPSLKEAIALCACVCSALVALSHPLLYLCCIAAVSAFCCIALYCNVAVFLLYSLYFCCIRCCILHSPLFAVSRCIARFAVLALYRDTPHLLYRRGLWLRDYT